MTSLPSISTVKCEPRRFGIVAAGLSGWASAILPRGTATIKIAKQIAVSFGVDMGFSKERSRVQLVASHAVHSIAWTNTLPSNKSFES